MNFRKWEAPETGFHRQKVGHADSAAKADSNRYYTRTGAVTHLQLHMKTLLCLLAALLLLPLAMSQAADAPAPASKPNIVFFLIDDLGYADCGFNGGKEIFTPHIDKLAKEGAVIEAHYVQPVCSPTRSALLTGRYPTHTGIYSVVRPKSKGGLPLAERTLASALKEVGYETAITGKWHLGETQKGYLPTSRGFDHQYGHYFGALDYNTHIRDGTHDWYRNDQELKEEGYTTHLVAKEACRLIADKDKAKPLFLYVPFNGVHSPMQVPDDYLKPYGALSGPRLKLAGMLAAVDEAIGQIVGALEKAGLRENTLIIFSSDNGGPRPGVNTPLRDYKGSIYEGGVRAAAFATWPGHIPGGVRIKEPMHIIDWYPTLIKLVGGSTQQPLPVDGLDIWPMLTQSTPTPHDAILHVQSTERAAIRMGDWKLVMNGQGKLDPVDAKGSGTTGKNNEAGAKRKKRAKRADAPKGFALYHLGEDISEEKDRAATEPERVSAMSAKLQEMLKGAVAPTFQ